MGGSKGSSNAVGGSDGSSVGGEAERKARETSDSASSDCTRRVGESSRMLSGSSAGGLSSAASTTILRLDRANAALFLSARRFLQALQVLKTSTFLRNQPTYESIILSHVHVSMTLA